MQRPWHRVWLQRSFTLVIAKAGKFAVWFGCHDGQRCWYSWRAPVVGSSVSNGNRVGGFFAFWFFSPSVELVQAVRERACGLGVRLNHGGERPLTRRSTGRQKRTAFGSLRCAPAPVTSALYRLRRVRFGVNQRSPMGSVF